MYTTIAYAIRDLNVMLNLDGGSRVITTDSAMSELNARIGYLNTGAALDRAVGATLDTWDIDIEAMQE